jgi:hypothetical protein
MNNETAQRPRQRGDFGGSFSGFSPTLPGTIAAGQEGAWQFLYGCGTRARTKPRKTTLTGHRFGGKVKLAGGFTSVPHAWFNCA